MKLESDKLFKRTISIRRGKLKGGVSISRGGHNPDGYALQIIDSVDVPGRSWTEPILAFPRMWYPTYDAAYEELIKFLQYEYKLRKQKGVHYEHKIIDGNS